jgi:HK97 family phage major capsid protein
MFTIEELKAKYKGYVSEAKSLLAGGKLDEATAKMGEADGIKAQIEAAERIGAGEAYLNEPAGTKAAHLGFRESMPDEGNAPVDGKSWRSFEIPIFGKAGIEKKEYRYFVPLAVDRKGYGNAFEAYLRFGKDGVGPNDRKALTEAVDSAGGYLVPEAMIAGILKKTATMATVRQYARVIQISRDIAKLTRIKYTTDNKYTSGIRLTWTGETPSSSTAHRVTDQVFGPLSAPVHTAMASQLISNDLIEDAAYDVMGISSELMGEAFALGENDVFWTGHGAGQPRGIVTDASDTAGNWDASVVEAGSAATFTADELLDVIYGLPAQYESNARVFMRKSTEKFIRKFSDTNGDYLWPIWNQVGNLGPTPREIEGFPVIRDEFVQAIPANGDTATWYPVVFGDLSGYTIVDRVGLSIQRNDSLYSETNNTLLLGRKRVGGQLTEAYRISLLKVASS